MKRGLLSLCCIFFLFSCTVSDKNSNSDLKKIKDLDFVCLQYEIKNMNDTRDIQINDRNISIISVFHDSILYDWKRLDEDSLYFIVKDFIKSDPENIKLPEFESVNLPIVGFEKVSKHLIVIQVDSSINYYRYFQIRHEILKAYNTLRDEYSREKFGVAYKDLFLNSKPEHSNYKLILDFKYPIRISEMIR